MTTIFTKGQLLEILKSIKNSSDNDIVAIEVHDCVLYQDLYHFYIDVITGIRLENGEEINEIRFTAIPNETQN